MHKRNATHLKAPPAGPGANSHRQVSHRVRQMMRRQRQDLARQTAARLSANGRNAAARHPRKGGDGVPAIGVLLVGRRDDAEAFHLSIHGGATDIEFIGHRGDVPVMLA